MDTKATLQKHFSVLTQQTLRDIAAHLQLVAGDDSSLDFDLLLELLVEQHKRRPSQLEAINTMPLYPTEEILWDINIVPSEYYNGESKCSWLPWQSSLAPSSPLTPISLITPHSPPPLPPLTPPTSPSHSLSRTP